MHFFVLCDIILSIIIVKETFMEILKNLLSEFKEILYDVFGYLVPGYFVLFILSIPFLIKESCSPMYASLEIFFKDDISINLINLLQDPTFLKLLILSFIAYLLGHLPNFLSSPIANFLGFIIKKLNFSIGKLLLFLIKMFRRTILRKPLRFIIKKLKAKRITDYEKTELLCTKVSKILSNKANFPEALFIDKNKKNKIMFDKYAMKTFASTYSRFTSHNDLIQKYTCKINFYNSLCCIFLIMFADLLTSSFIWVSVNTSMYKPSILAKMVILDLFLFLCFLTFYSQYERHTNLKNKECYLFLYNYFCPKGKS